MGCGMCVASCPSGAIAMKLHVHRGLWRPVVDKKKCTSCGKCLQVCAGVEVNFPALAERFLGERPDEGMLGVRRACYFAHACDEDIRYRSASGGLVTALLLYALQQDIVDAAVVTRMSDRDPLETEAILAETPEQVAGASGSKYCPSTIGPPLREILERDGRFAVVGLPCQLHSLRKLEAITQELCHKIRFHFGILCLNNNTFLGTRYFLKEHGIDPKQVAEIRYRDKGWPGWITVRMRDGSRKEIDRRSKQPRDIRALRRAFQVDFIVPRCLLCPDQFAELADLSFGDPWNPLYVGKETVGKSLLIARTEAGHDLLLRASEDGAIDLTPTDDDMPLECQRTEFKSNVGARLKLRRMLRLPVPLYPQRALPVRPGHLGLQKKYATCYLTSRFHWTWCLLPLVPVLGKICVWFRQLPGRVLRRKEQAA